MFAGCHAWPLGPLKEGGTCLAGGVAGEISPHGAWGARHGLGGVSFIRGGMGEHEEMAAVLRHTATITGAEAARLSSACRFAVTAPGNPSVLAPATMHIRIS